MGFFYLLPSLEGLGVGYKLSGISLIIRYRYFRNDEEIGLINKISLPSLSINFTMSIKAALSLLYAKFVCNKIAKWSNNPIVSQEKVFTTLIKQGGNTEFGKDHNFNGITDYETFKKNVPVKDYEDLKPYIEKIKAGQENILWPGLPNYFSKTSGTTSGAKYIPIQ